ncbi:MAG: hypothetical protein WBP92_06770, partial [Candidatus Acidiferrales bacterium]
MLRETRLVFKPRTVVATLSQPVLCESGILVIMYLTQKNRAKYSKRAIGAPQNVRFAAFDVHLYKIRRWIRRSKIVQS